MDKKCKCPPEGAPEWMVTYGDMVTLLLCFFVLIVAFSEIKKENDFQAVVEEIKKAFGMKGGGGKLPTKEDPELSLVERLEALQLQQQQQKNESNAQDPGMEGKEPETKIIRPGLLFVIGGPITFEPGSADLSDTAKAQLMHVVEQTRGMNNLIELHGHASSMERDEAKKKFSDLWDLSGARAKAVMRFLTSEAVGLEAKRFRVIENADHQPAVNREYTSQGQEPNRRVEVVVSENLIREFTQPVTRIR